ncbi:hypothetical protein [Deinococcus yavapaiensis]|uniref:Uncharacterized protein n=1 Tax=Deinococcus yavapaiensis KR-236 TaxID=694435 RepID=A0A318S3J1_9DEIO|nr:hypothetical protein [Deinococcus yavapaiensis]PYE48981.1 hypothetical protein DES52_12647 [Deinococcus yavapaiensis KR-236]
MIYLTFEALEITSAVAACPELSERWRQAARHNLVKSVGLGRYTAVLDSDLAALLRKSCPNVPAYSYDDQVDRVQEGDALHSILA